MNETMTPLREYYSLMEVLKRLRGDEVYNSGDIEAVCVALEHRLANEEKMRTNNRNSQRRYRAAKRKEAAE